MLNSPVGIHKDIKIKVGTIGHEQQPLILVDNFIDTPEAMIDVAAKELALTETKDLYPGIRARIPDYYLNLIQAHLGPLIYKTFDLIPEDVKGAEALFSIVSTPPDRLHDLQRIPHMDGTNPKDIAFLHFLCDESYGGTSFYRHKSTGHEFVDQSRYRSYLATLEREIAAVGLPYPPQYMNGDNALFRRLVSIEARFNRLIIYRGTSLHSGDIGADYDFDSNPRSGRLTATSFLYSA